MKDLAKAGLFALVLLFSLTTALAAESTVNINEADAETLAARLDGVGATRAAAIVGYREANGPFGSVDELTAVSGIGDSTLEANRDRLVVE